MKIQRIQLIFLFITVALMPVYLFAQTRRQTQTSIEDTRIGRLAGLAKIWGAVKYFHPFPAYKEIDWDKSLIETIPKITAAKSEEEYATVINSMLAALGDKETTAKVKAAENSKPKTETISSKQTPARIENGVLYYDLLAASRITFTEYQKLNDFAAEVTKLLPQAKAVVIDARGLDETNTEVLAEFDYEMKEILPLMLDRNITLGTIRYRMHNGYASQDAKSSGSYYSSFITDMPQPFAGNYQGKTLPIVFLIDESSYAVLPTLSGMQTANKAFVIADGASAAGGDFYTMQLPENVQVKMRTTELVNPDGSIGFEPDLTVPQGQSLKTAQSLITENKFISNRTKQNAAQIGLVSQNEKTYAEMEFPDPNYRLLALFRFWNIINYFYPHKNIIGTEWETILTRYIPQFEADRDALAYRITAQKMVAEIHDSHGFFDAPLLKSVLPNYFPPFAEDYAEDKLFVKAVLTENTALKAGDVILEADDVPIENLINEYASRIAASTPQALMRDVKNRGIFRGAKDSTMKLKVLGLDGVIREIKTKRSILYNDPINIKYRILKRETPVVSILPSGFGYIDIDRLAASSEEIDKAFETIKNVPAVIFDMRGYPRGDTQRIYTHLTSKPLASAVFSRPYRDAKDLNVTYYEDGANYSFLLRNEPNNRFQGEIYKGKIIVLINENTQSAAEGAAGRFANARPDTVFIGTPTAGANGDVTYMVLPGNIKVAFTGHNVRRYDGQQLQRVGIQPTIKAAPTIRGIIENKDEILDAAVRFLQKH